MSESLQGVLQALDEVTKEVEKMNCKIQLIPDAEKAQAQLVDILKWLQEGKILWGNIAATIHSEN